MGEDNFLLQAFIHQNSDVSAQSKNWIAYESELGRMHKAIFVYKDDRASTLSNLHFLPLN